MKYYLHFLLPVRGVKQGKCPSVKMMVSQALAEYEILKYLTHIYVNPTCDE